MVMFMWSPEYEIKLQQITCLCGIMLEFEIWIGFFFSVIRTNCCLKKDLTGHMTYKVLFV